VNYVENDRIAIISPLFSDPLKHGGITPVVWNLAGSIAGFGIEVDLIVRRPDPAAQLPVCLPDNIAVTQFPTGGRLKTALFLAGYMKKNKSSVLLAAGHRFNMAAVWASRLAPGSRVFLSAHNTMSIGAAQRGPIHRYKRMKAAGAFYPWADGIVAVSRGVAEDLLKNTRIPAAKIKVIHNPIVTKGLLDRSREPVDHPWFQPGEPPVIIGAGRLSSQKAFHILIEAFALVRREQQCRLVILGEGSERSRLESLTEQLRIAGDVDLPGFVENPHAWVAKSSLFVLSSFYEGFGNVLVEALAVQTPVVSTDCPSGPSEILGGGRFGRLVPPGDKDALAAAILEALADPDPPPSFKDAVRPFKADKVAKQYLLYMGFYPG
jgi:glycosyltransferase involved in cell wall biosynthesis